MPALRINVGPSAYDKGVDWLATIRMNGEWDSFDTGGWGGTHGAGPRRSTSPNAWLTLAKRRLVLPSPVKKAGLLWGDATVTPFGYSQGAGHVPSGITLTWSW